MLEPSQRRVSLRLPLQEDMGGFTFENSREVLCWVNFVLQRPANGEVQLPPRSIEQAGRAACQKTVRRQQASPMRNLLTQRKQSNLIPRLPPPHMQPCSRRSRLVPAGP